MIPLPLYVIGYGRGGPRMVGVCRVISGAAVLAAAVRESIGWHGREIVASQGSPGDVLSAGGACSGAPGSDSSVSWLSFCGTFGCLPEYLPPTGPILLGGLPGDVRAYLATCMVCLARKSPGPRRDPLGHLEVSNRWDRVAMDILDKSVTTPVEWCTVCKGSASECFSLPWTVPRDFWQTALHLDVSGVAVDVRLFHESGCLMVHKYRVYRDPFPHPALRGWVMNKLLALVSRAMAIAELTHLHITIPASGSAGEAVPEECFPTVPLPQVSVVTRFFRQRGYRPGCFPGIGSFARPGARDIIGYSDSWPGWSVVSWWVSHGRFDYNFTDERSVASSSAGLQMLRMAGGYWETGRRPFCDRDGSTGALGCFRWSIVAAAFPDSQWLPGGVGGWKSGHSLEGDGYTLRDQRATVHYSWISPVMPDTDFVHRGFHQHSRLSGQSGCPRISGPCSTVAAGPGGPFSLWMITFVSELFWGWLFFPSWTYRPSDYTRPSGRCGAPLHHPRFWSGLARRSLLVCWKWDRRCGYTLCQGNRLWRRLANFTGTFALWQRTWTFLINMCCAFRVRRRKYSNLVWDPWVSHPRLSGPYGPDFGSGLLLFLFLALAKVFFGLPPCAG